MAKPSQTSEARWQTIFENMKDTVLVVNRHYRILSINHLQQGFTIEDVIGQELWNFVTPEKSNYIKSNCERMFKTGSSFEVEDLIHGPDGSEFWYYSVYSPIVDATGKIKEFMIITRNITVMKRAEQIVLNAVIDGQEEERKRVAGELHDGLGQNISAIRMGLMQLEGELKRLNSAKSDKTFINIKGLIGKASDEVQSISRNLAPPRIEDYGLGVVLKDYCKQMEGLYKLKINFKALNLDVRLKPELETAVYRMVQELINNIVKHAKATKAAVHIERGDKLLNIKVKDNGKGFDTTKASKGLGLQNINTRAKIHKGEVFVYSKKGKGTETRVEIPVG